MAATVPATVQMMVRRWVMKVRKVGFSIVLLLCEGGTAGSTCRSDWWEGGGLLLGLAGLVHAEGEAADDEQPQAEAHALAEAAPEDAAVLGLANHHHARRRRRQHIREGAGRRARDAG